MEQGAAQRHAGRRRDDCQVEEDEERPTRLGVEGVEPGGDEKVEDRQPGAVARIGQACAEELDDQVLDNEDREVDPERVPGPAGERNRELRELLEELRVILPGAEVLFAFLLTLPFMQRFSAMSATSTSPPSSAPRWLWHS